MHLLVFEVIDLAVGIIRKHLCKYAEEGETVVPIAVALGAASVLFESAKVIICYYHHSRELRLDLLLGSEVKIGAKNACDTYRRPVVCSCEPAVLSVSTLCKGIDYTISNLRLSSLVYKLGELITYEIQHLGYTVTKYAGAKVKITSAISYRKLLRHVSRYRPGLKVAYSPYNIRKR